MRFPLLPLIKLLGFINIILDELVHLGEDIPKETNIENKTTVEQIKLIQELDQEEKKYGL